ncbi:MAG: cation diffusion facilitator family transporter [Elusimicrobiota bacterium]
MEIKDKLYKKGLRLEYFTVGYNTLEAVLSILFGSMAGSIALVGFGMDSIIESLSGLVLIWRLRKYKDLSEEEEQEVEQKAMKFVAVTFFILGSYVLYQAAKKIIFAKPAHPSLPGIIIAGLSIIIMPVLAFQKLKVGKGIGSNALIADSKETLACMFLSVALLLGLGANYLFGFWQADPVAGLIITYFLFREGVESWKEAKEG